MAIVSRPYRYNGSAAGLWQFACGAGACAILAGWYVLMYGDCTQHFFHWDDFRLLGAASRLSISGPVDLVRLFRPGPTATFFYRPLSEVGHFWLLEQLFGYDAAPYHAVQLCANVANAVLVYAIASTILQSRGAGLATALVYAAGPGHAMAVYWNAAFSITGTAFWYFACLLAWLCVTERCRGVICVALFALSLLHGEAAITIPLILTLSILVEKGANLQRRIRELLPVYAIALVYGMAKAWYFRFGFVKDFPTPIDRAFVLSHYGPAFGLAGALQTLGYYCACSFSWFYRATTSESLLYGLAGLWLVGLAASIQWARRSDAGRVVLFGMSFFIVALGPLLTLPNHRYMYLIGVAAFGSSLALVAAVRAIPHVGQLLTVGVVAGTLAVEAVSTSALVRESTEFGFLRDFQVGAASWLQAVDRKVQLKREIREVIVPQNTLTSLVFKLGEGHRLFYGATYQVKLVDAKQPPAAGAASIVVWAAPPWRPGVGWPGQQGQWNWLRWSAR